MSEADPNQGDWNDAIAQAEEHVEERGHAAEEAAARQRPKAEGPMIAAALVALVAVSIWNVRSFSKPPTDIPVDEEVHLAWFVADAVEAIQDFQEDEGRLPSDAEATDLLEEDITYSSVGEVFTITVVGEDGMSVSYESSTPLRDWLTYQAEATEGGRP